MNLVSIAWKSIRQRWLASSLTALSIALGVALMVAVLVINGVVTRMFDQNATGFDLIIGAKGSPMQLVLNTIYFLDRPIENIPYKYYLDLKKKSWVAHAIPFALGDTTADGKYRIIGTIPEYFELEFVPGRKFQLQPGGKFLEGTFDAVIGARVARAYGWKVGDKFPIAHGGDVRDIHDQKFTVVGILAPTGLPIDRAVFIDYEGFYKIPGHEMTEQEARAEAQARRGADGDAEIMVPAISQGAEAAGKKRPATGGEPISDEQKRVTAVLVQMKGSGPAEQAALTFLVKPLINKAPVAQAVNPIEQIKKLLVDVVGNIRIMLLAMTILIIIVSGVGIFVSIYNSMADRKREIAIMRALGAPRLTMFSIIVAEAVLLCAAGGILGLALGHGLVFVAGPIVEARSDILIDPWFFEVQELMIMPALLILAVVVGLVPGMTAYRADVARGLSD
ncbi:MAG TPA: ABC transporter permease [Planctomycetaceae bacterium]|nr:ABC transporter permease [Planctomycetaceae bacterium]